MAKKSSKRRSTGKKRTAKSVKRRSNTTRYWMLSGLFLLLCVSLILWSHQLRKEMPSGDKVKTDSNAISHQKSEITEARQPVAHYQDSKGNASGKVETIISANIELPETQTQEFVISNTAGRYTISYDTARCQPRWVAYKLTRTDLEKGTARSNSFTTDRNITARGWRASTNNDYKGSGYDKGHLVPSADRCGNQAENRATFTLSNTSPQYASFNRGVWKLLEENVRSWCQKCDTLYIVTGGIVTDGCQTIGNNKVHVPDIFFKTIVARRGDRFEAVAYLIPHRQDCGKDIERFRVSVDSVEMVSGLNLYHSLPDEIENSIESNTGFISFL